MEFGSQTIAEQKNTLRTWFARYFDDGMTKEDVENWFDTLGACTGKEEISRNKEKLTAYLMQTKGFSTGEDFVLSLSSGTKFYRGRTGGTFRMHEGRKP